MGGRSNALVKTAPAAITPIAVARPSLPTAAQVMPYLERIDAGRWYSNFGPLLSEFEARLADRFTDGAHVVTCVNATQGLTLALKALGLPQGGLVAMPSYTFVATAHAVVQAGLTPWFLDVDEADWMLRPQTVADALVRAPGPVVAAVPVAPFGAMPDLEAWHSFRDRTGLAVVIDGAAAFDQVVRAPLPIVVSLHATKVMGLGEGGFVATTDPALADAVRRMTVFGFHESRTSLAPATNAKLSEYAAAVGLAALDAWPHDRLRWMRAGQMLRAALLALPQVRFQPGWSADWATSVSCVALPDGVADRVEAVLAAEGVQTRRWWGDGCHRTPAFAACPREDLAATERLADCVLGLPFAIDISPSDINRIAAALGRALSN